MQTHAVVSNITVIVPENLQVTCAGSAALAAVVAREDDSIEEATVKMVRFNIRIALNNKNHEIYKKIFA